jgi:hypothetical protein
MYNETENNFIQERCSQYDMPFFDIPTDALAYE